MYKCFTPYIFFIAFAITGGFGSLNKLSNEDKAFDYIKIICD